MPLPTVSEDGVVEGVGVVGRRGGRGGGRRRGRLPGGGRGRGRAGDVFIAFQHRHLCRVDPVLGLGREPVVSPERACRPIGSTLPDAVMLRHVIEHVAQRRQAGRVGADAELPEEEALAVLLGPVRDRRQAVDACRRRGHGRARPGAVAVEILVDLEGVVVLRIHHSLADDVGVVRGGGRPGPGAVVVDAGHQDLLGRARVPDGRDGRVDRPEPSAGAGLIRFVHQPEHDVRVAGVVAGQLAPQRRESRDGDGGRPDVLAVIPTIIMCIEVDFETFRRGIVHHVVDPLQLGGVERLPQDGLQALPQERQPDDVHPLRGFVVDLGMRRILIIDAVVFSSRVEIAPREVDPEKI